MPVFPGRDNRLRGSGRGSRRAPPRTSAYGCRGTTPTQRRQGPEPRERQRLPARSRGSDRGSRRSLLAPMYGPPYRCQARPRTGRSSRPAARRGVAVECRRADPETRLDGDALERVSGDVEAPESFDVRGHVAMRHIEDEVHGAKAGHLPLDPPALWKRVVQVTARRDDRSRRSGGLGECALAQESGRGGGCRGCIRWVRRPET